jgi:pimeloyl-ACP methyl ester carboxylesterase
MVAALAMRDGIVPQRAVYVAPMIDITSYGEPFVRMLGGGVERRLGLRMSFFDLPAMASELNTPPRLIVHDREDRETSWDASRRLASRWPDTQLLTTTGLGHNRVLSDAAVVSAAIDFIHSGTRTSAIQHPQASSNTA